ncbi:hypothetical protein ACYRE2_09915 [Listeria seeligeri]|uniref:hypothetical protein n=1 Tax=Listeria seeligeri TaxID=1640 RepID=UPI0022EB23FD|nr:hypothetical protein [Listeria seeligeri]
MTAKAYQIAGAILLIFSLWLNWHTYTESKALEKELNKEEKNAQKWKKSYEQEQQALKLEENNQEETVEIQAEKDTAYEEVHVMEEQMEWNKEALRALFNYKNLTEREKNLDYYLTEPQKEKMEQAKSDSDNADGGSSLKSQSSFYQSISDDSFSTWNILKVEMEAEGVKTDVSLLANLTYTLEEGKWLLSDMTFQESN